MPRPPESTRRRPRREVDRRRLISLAVAVVVAAVPWFVTFDDLSPEGHRLFSVFLAAVVLWVTEAIPLHATAALIIGAQIVLISDEAILSLPEGYEAPGFATFYAALADPILMLFLGGFVLADLAARYGLDRNLARVLLRPFGTRPAAVLAGVMTITAILSMFTSNTATTAAMIAVVLPLVAGLDADDPLRVGVILAVPVAANVGGIGTPVGTPPNAIALGQLNSVGDGVTFLEWMALAVPLALVVLAVAWFALLRFHPPRAETIELTIEGRFDRSRPALILYATFAATIALWLTEPLHGVPSTIVGFLPVVVLMATGLFGVDDLKAINWHVLWLVAGGLALGTGVAATGFDTWLIGLVEWGDLPTLALLAGLAAFALTLSTLISNSATANLLIPIGLSLAVSGTIDAAPLLIGVVIAVACSLAMALPVSTPPNAIAYSTGMVSTRHLATTGIVVGLVGGVLLVVVMPLLWDAVGLVPS
ncbi:MAG TPA: DASS family sodium-coupled anion symporter [Acidimicrobiales bacterium]|nr:DASS family sodium-coupled anion symporter [Acidimicrobiales bacterium]